MGEDIKIPMTRGTLTEVAKLLGIKKNSLIYRIRNKDVEALGLIEKVEKEKANEEKKRNKKFDKILNSLNDIVN